ncbi:hypothetical protein ACWGB8_29070 [Kitasatospora sp. NPDC054939]
MVDYHELSNARIEVLVAAANAWDEVVKKVTGTDLEWETSVTGKVNAAEWTGASADAAKPVVQRVGDDLTLSLGRARDIGAALRSAADDIGAQKDRLHAIVADAQADGLTVSSDGTVSWPPADFATQHDPDARDAYQRNKRERAELARHNIDECVYRATEADTRASGLLRTAAG